MHEQELLIPHVSLDFIHRIALFFKRFSADPSPALPDNL